MRSITSTKSSYAAATIPTLEVWHALVAAREASACPALQGTVRAAHQTQLGKPVSADSSPGNGIVKAEPHNKRMSQEVHNLAFHLQFLFNVFFNVVGIGSIKVELVGPDLLWCDQEMYSSGFHVGFCPRRCQINSLCLHMAVILFSVLSVEHQIIL